MDEGIRLILSHPWLLYLFEGTLVMVGAMIGSFLNVCIYRIPRDLSLVYPRSACPECNKMIVWYDNIPLLSFLFLGGACRGCGSPISRRYPFVEGLNAFLYWFSFRLLGPSPEWLVAMALSSTMIVVSFIDLDFQIIPNRITYPGIVLGLILSILWPSIHVHGEELTRIQGFLRSLTGVLGGYGVLFLLGLISFLKYKKEAMGRGDFKLLALLGSLVGWRGVLWIVFLSCLSGSLIGIFLIITKRQGRKEYIPFGPFLAFAGFLVFLFGEQLSWIWQMYFYGTYIEGSIR